MQTPASTPQLTWHSVLLPAQSCSSSQKIISALPNRSCNSPALHRAFGNTWAVLRMVLSISKDIKPQQHRTSPPHAEGLGGDTEGPLCDTEGPPGRAGAAPHG